jgi:hypothetical protein
MKKSLFYTAMGVCLAGNLNFRDLNGARSKRTALRKSSGKTDPGDNDSGNNMAA